MKIKVMVTDRLAFQRRKDLYCLVVSNNEKDKFLKKYGMEKVLEGMLRPYKDVRSVAQNKFYWKFISWAVSNCPEQLHNSICDYYKKEWDIKPTREQMQQEFHMSAKAHCELKSFAFHKATHAEATLFVENAMKYISNLFNKYYESECYHPEKIREMMRDEI